MTFWRAISPLRIFQEIVNIVKELPSTNWLPFVASLMSVLTAIVYMAAMLISAIKGAKFEVDYVAFGMWLGFLAGMAGFSVKQFQIKRETHVNGDGKSIRHAKVEAELQREMNKANGK